MVLTLAVSGIEALKWVGYFIVALLCLMLMIMLHELGHYTFGKIFKFKINEFAIGFGPKIFSKKNKKTGEVFSVRAIPLGGFCAFAGEDEEGESNYDFNKRPVWQRIIVLFAGAGFNFLSAFIVITIFFSAYGEYFPVVGNAYQHVEYVDGEKYTVLEGSQQLQAGDVILSINGKNCYSLLEYNRLSSLISGEGDSLTVVVLRDGEKLTLNVTKQYYVTNTGDAENKEDGGEANTQVSATKGLGISMGAYSVQKLSAGQAFTHGATFGYDVLRVTVNSIKQLFAGTVSVGESMGGTATAIFSLAQLVQAGIPAIIYGFCILSTSIGIMNVLPLPALDGSRIIFAIVEAIRKKPLNRQIEGTIHFVGLIVLFALAIILDLVHFFG
ncbi:MAG: site-2 protease family protein [Clostridia bacterium]|nr:site-2 protease family protein [Clostridia bacterium]MDE7328654.1 site-2 protease family protein [Clostridia bacterium]